MLGEDIYRALRLKQHSMSVWLKKTHSMSVREYSYIFIMWTSVHEHASLLQYYNILFIYSIVLLVSIFFPESFVPGKYSSLRSHLAESIYASY